MLDLETTPEWMINYSGFKDELPEKMLDSRVVFYPGAGDDLHPLEIFGRPGYAHCFIHADYKGGNKNISPTVIAGYKIIDQKELSYDFVANAFKLIEEHPYPNHWTKFVNLEEIKKGLSFWSTFKRTQDCDSQGGPEMLVLFQIFGEAVWVYWNLWSRRKTHPYAVLLQDHRVGGLNWRDFGGSEAPLYNIAKKAGLPPFLVVGQNTNEWPGYQKIESVGQGGMRSFERNLYERK